MKKLLFVFFLLFTSVIYSQEFIIDEPYEGLFDNNIETERNPGASVNDEIIPYIGNLPTPDNLKKSDFLTEFNIYDNGGFNTRLIVGIFDVFDIGVSESLDGVIGSEKINVNIPGAYLKLSLFDKPEKFNAAVGFDNFTLGKNGAYTSTNGVSSSIYGFYVVGGFSYIVFESRNMFSFGFRFPLLPGEFRDIKNSSFFIGGTLGTQKINFGFTIENIYLDFTRPAEILPSIIVSYSPSPGITLKIALQYDSQTSSVNRLLSLGYKTGF